MNKTNQLLYAALLLGACQQVFAQNVIIYPGKGQSAQQQQQDMSECGNWAKSTAGYDPANQAASAPPAAPPPQQSGGIARGALGGAAIGAIAGDSSKAAWRGAAAGALFGGIRQARGNQQAQQQQQQQQQQQIAAKQNDYNRAYAACLEARGYTVK